jgi:hypothetical protein
MLLLPERTYDLEQVMINSIVEGYDGCAVEVHDCQDNRVGRASVRAKE